MWILKFDKRSNYEKQGFRNLHCGTKLSHIQAREIIMKLIITSMKSIIYSFSNKSNEKTFLQYFPVILKRIFRLTGNLEDMFLQHDMDSEVISTFKFSITHWSVTRQLRVAFGRDIFLVLDVWCHPCWTCLRFIVFLLNNTFYDISAISHLKRRIRGNS